MSPEQEEAEIELITDLALKLWATYKKFNTDLVHRAIMQKIAEKVKANGVRDISD